MKYKIKPLIKGRNYYFLGYYNHSQISKDNNKTIIIETDFMNKHPGGKDSAKILLKDNQTGKIREIAETKAWNWQQGCMIQWLGPDFNSKIIFNDLDKKNNKFISRIINIHTKKEKIIPFPIYDVDCNGKYALSMSYEKLDNVREGYGYKKDNKRSNKTNSKEEGILLINLEKKTSKIIIKLKDLYNYQSKKSMKKGEHWLDQPVFNPSGDRFCFLHRWKLEGGLFYSRFFTSNLKGDDLFLFPDSGFYSHFTWRNNQEILVWCSVSNKFANIRKGDKKSSFLIRKILPIYRKLIPRVFRKRILPVGYYLLKDKTNNYKKIKIYHEDGHPSFSKDKKYVITDTYPNSKNYRKLILYDWKKRKRDVLGKFYSIPKKEFLKREIKDFGNSGLRCDLHPRWNFQGDKVTFDSVHNGKRNCYLIEF